MKCPVLTSALLFAGVISAAKATASENAVTGPTNQDAQQRVSIDVIISGLPRGSGVPFVDKFCTWVEGLDVEQPLEQDQIDLALQFSNREIGKVDKLIGTCDFELGRVYSFDPELNLEFHEISQSHKNIALAKKERLEKCVEKLEAMRQALGQGA